MAIRSCLAALGLVLSLTSGALAAADPPQCRTVRIGDGGWTDNIAQNGLAMVVLKALGYEPTTTLLSYAVVLESLKNKQIDVFLDHWSPSVDSMVEPYLKENAFEKLNTNLTGAKYTLAVPAYVWATSRTSRPTRTSSAARSTASNRAATRTSSCRR
jgi:glycine betaine/proline transport system substrate-binding protein